jgi:hypothetical protein
VCRRRTVSSTARRNAIGPRVSSTRWSQTVDWLRTSRYAVAREETSGDHASFPRSITSSQKICLRRKKKKKKKKRVDCVLQTDAGASRGDGGCPRACWGCRYIPAMYPGHWGQSFGRSGWWCSRAAVDNTQAADRDVTHHVGFFFVCFVVFFFFFFFPSHFFSFYLPKTDIDYEKGLVA